MNGILRTEYLRVRLVHAPSNKPGWLLLVIARISNERARRSV